MDYTRKSYGRNEETTALYRHFDAGHDILMPGPRRLGKSFVLDRLVERADAHGWTAIKVDFAGCNDGRAAFRELCSALDETHAGGKKLALKVKQAFGQLADPPRTNGGEPWYAPYARLDHATYFDRLVGVLNEDSTRRWVLLIDELPIFLKALHDKGPDGMVAAREFMNTVSHLRERYPRVRWMVTGSIGITPLANEGQYLGVMAKFRAFDLAPLDRPQSAALLKDLASGGQLQHRTEITDVEADALVDAVGWRSAHYLDALAQQLRGTPTSEPERARVYVESAVDRLLAPVHRDAFGPWEEHLRKHYRERERTLGFDSLAALSAGEAGMTLDNLLSRLARPELSPEVLKALMIRLNTEGFVAIDDLDSDSPTYGFLNPLLRRWWKRYTPQA